MGAAEIKARQNANRAASLGSKAKAKAEKEFQDVRQKRKKTEEALQKNAEEKSKKDQMTRYARADEGKAQLAAVQASVSKEIRGARKITRQKIHARDEVQASYEARKVAEEE